MGTNPAFSSKIISVDSWKSPITPDEAKTNAVPMFGWPANGTSKAGVKIRTYRVFPFSGGKTNELSEKLNSRAICCICLSESPSASGNTARGFPPNLFFVNTSHM